MAINPENIDTVSVDELPPALFNVTDKIPHSIEGNLFSGTVQDLIDILRLNSNAFQNELKFLQVDNQYIIDNFDETGLGTNLCLGWAICNGNNDTAIMDGIVPIGYGSTYNTVGQFGGSKTHTLSIAEMPIHSHTISNQSNNDNGFGKVSVGSTAPEGTNPVTDTAGGGQPHNNMQPYIVTLIIKKL